MSTPREARLRYVDSLRVLAIAVVLVVHVAEVFDPWDNWHITNRIRSRAVGEIAVLAAPWVMPLLMLLAGVSAWYSLPHRDNRAYLRDRVMRVLLPLGVGVLVLVPPQVYLERRLNGQFHGSFFEFYPCFFEGIYPRGNLSWHHLWFLAHLFLYALVTLPLFRYMQRTPKTRALRWAERVSLTSAGVLWLAIPLVIERSALWGFFPERHMLTSDWSNHALLLVAYVYGFLLAGTPWLGQAIDAQWRRVLLVAVVGTAALMLGTWHGVLPAELPPPYSWLYLGFWMLYSVCAWAWMVALLGVARRWMNRDSATVRYGRRVGYAVYLVHQPIVVALAYVVVQSAFGVGTKFVLLLVTSAAASIGAVELLMRVPGVSRVLAGGGASTRDSGSVRELSCVVTPT